MNEFLVSTDNMGVIHLYDCNFSRPGPDRSWHGFRSYQDLSDFFTFALRGPAVGWVNGVETRVTLDPSTPDLPPFNEMTKEGRRGEYSRRPDDRVPPSLVSLEVVQPVVPPTDQAEARPACASASVPDSGDEVGIFGASFPWGWL